MFSSLFILTANIITHTLLVKIISLCSPIFPLPLLLFFSRFPILSFHLETLLLSIPFYKSSSPSFFLSILFCILFSPRCLAFLKYFNYFIYTYLFKFSSPRIFFLLLSSLLFSLILRSDFFSIFLKYLFLYTYFFIHLHLSSPLINHTFCFCFPQQFLVFFSYRIP